MSIVVVIATAFLASLLTFFSGFGLGTILTPVFMLFFPIELAIAMTGVVHLLNNMFKFILIGKHINYSIFLKFGLAGIGGAYLGANLLFKLQGSTKGDIEIAALNQTTNFTNIVIAVVMIVFALFEIIPRLKNINFGAKMVIPGGIISGFFGGLSGHQGALRSAFLIKFNLDKKAFVATGIGIACLIDIMRLSIYYNKLGDIDISENISLITIACLSAFSGAYLGKRLLDKITIEFIQHTVAIAIIILAIGLGLGYF